MCVFFRKRSYEVFKVNYVISRKGLSRIYMILSKEKWLKSVRQISNWLIILVAFVLDHKDYERILNLSVKYEET